MNGEGENRNVLKLPSGHIRLCTHVGRSVGVAFGEVGFGGDAVHALHGVDEEDADESTWGYKS
jgi:hypothetical protein